MTTYDTPAVGLVTEARPAPELSHQYDEKEMVTALSKGNKQVLKQLYLEYSGLFFTIARRYARSSQEAEDMVQESFVQIYRKASTFSFNGSFEGWMKRVVVHKCLSMIKKKTLQMDSSVEDIDADGKAVQASHVVEQMSAEEILQAITELPEGARVILNMCVLDGFSHKEIAEQLGITESASRSQLTKARARLKMILEEKELLVR